MTTSTFAFIALLVLLVYTEASDLDGTCVGNDCTDVGVFLQSGLRTTLEALEATYNGTLEPSVVQQKAHHDKTGLDKFVLSLFGINAAKPEVDQLVEDLQQALIKSGVFAKVEGHVGQQQVELAKQVQQYDEWATSLKLNTVCETGFNAGHSALRFLALSDATVYEFDLGKHNYSKVAADFLHRSFPGRLNMFWGDSRRVVPEFHARRPEVKCDLLIVDGGHSDDVALSDLETFGRMASENHVVVMDDTPCQASYCDGPKNAWQQLINDGCLVHESAVKMGKRRGFSFGRFRPCARLQEHH